MADNTPVTAGAGTNIATDEVTFSGDTAHVQLIHPVIVTGAEGSKVTAEVFKAEDAAHTSGDFGIQMLAVRQDTATTGLGVDGDYAPPRLDANGRLQVTIGGTGPNDLGKAEDAVHNSSDVGVLALAVRRDAASSGVSADGDYAALSVDSTGALRVVGSSATTQYAEDSPAANADSLVIVGAVRRDVAAGSTTADGDYSTLSVDANGALRVSGASGTTQYTEDNPSAGGESLVLVGAVRRDTAASSSGLDGDYSTLNTDSAGALRVTVDSATSSSIKTDDAAFTPATDKVAMVGAEYDDTGTDLVDEGDAGAMRMSANRNLYVRIRDNAGNERGLNIDASGNATVNVTGTVTVGSHAVTNAGTFAVQADSVVPGTGATNLGKLEDGAHNTGDVGVMALAVRAAAPTDRSAGPTDGDYEPLAVNEQGAVWSTLTPSANGGCSTFMASGSDGSSILVATAQAVKASAGVLYGYYAYNPEAAVTFVHFYNTAAASVTVGTTNPLFTIAIPATSAANLALPYGITFSNAGWSVAATTTAGGTGAPATGVSLVAWYK